MIFLLGWAICSFLVIAKLAGFGKQFWTFLLIVSTVISLFCGSWIKQILLVALCYIFNGIIDIIMGYGVCALLGISYSDFVWKKLLYITVATTAKFMELFLSFLVWKIRKRNPSMHIRKTWLLLTALFPTVSLTMLVVLFATLQNEKDLPFGLFIFSAVLAAANIGILYLIQIMEKRTREERELALISQQTEIQTKNIIALEKSYRAQRRASHEFQHHMQTISDLLQNAKYAETVQYVTKLQDSHSSRIFAVNTHHPILDAVLNQKYQLAREQGIEMRLTVNDLSTIELSTSELVVIFANLLDNAIEACDKVEGDREIHCVITTSEKLYFSIRNTSIPVAMSNGVIETSKASHLEHGYGLPTVCHILENLNAEYTYEYSSGWFQFVAEIPM